MNRKFFYQWDLDRRIELPNVAVGTEVHFYSQDETEGLKVLSYEKNGVVYANVPNILLQMAGSLKVYVWPTYTTQYAKITVIARPKPSSYVYTETEVLNYVTLEKRIAELEKNGGGSGSGVAGEDGATFTPNVSDDGVLSWTNDKGLPNPTSVNVKGKDGKDGVSPHIGENGNWWIGDTDSGTKAKIEDAYDVIITSQEQFLSETLEGKKVLVKDAKFNLRTMDFGGAEYVEFCNVSVGSEEFAVTILNFKIGNFVGLKMGWSTDDTHYHSDYLTISHFKFAENLIPTNVHGSGEMIYYSGGVGMINCAVSVAINCCNIINCHVIGRNASRFMNCDTISNLHAKYFYGNDVTFENCTHLSNIALSGANVTYISCSNVDAYTCDGYSAAQLPEVTEEDNGKILQVVGSTWKTADLPPAPDVDKAYVDSLVGDIGSALDELHTYAQNLANGGSAE
jgi:hypothetical protein